MHIHTTDFCVLILYPGPLLDSSNSFLVEFLGFGIYEIAIFKWRQFYLFSNSDTFDSLPARPRLGLPARSRAGAVRVGAPSSHPAPALQGRLFSLLP